MFENFSWDNVSKSLFGTSDTPEEKQPPAQPEQPTQPSITLSNRKVQDAIRIMEKGWLDPSPASDPAPAVSSREWRNRKAKEVAEQFIKKGTDYSNVDLNTIWGHVLRAEGGYANNPADPGGETKYGISKRSYSDLDIGNLTEQDAQQIFKSDYFDKVGGDVLLKINPGLAAHVADMAFNAGPQAAIKLMYDAAGLPRESQITQELIDSLDSSEDFVKNYSVARLKYYASLGNADTFIKGWTNRVNNLNKALGVKSGLNGAYKAARDMDLDSLIIAAGSKTHPTASLFAELTADEKDYLRSSNLMLSPGYRPRPGMAILNDNKTSSISEVFKATYDDHYYLNTNTGHQALIAESAQVVAEGVKHELEKQGVSKDWIYKITTEPFDGSHSLDYFAHNLERFQKENPDVKLTYKGMADVYNIANQRALQIEDRYNKLDSGSFTGGIGEAAKKLFHVAAGYLPAHIAASFMDPTEAALNMLPIGGAGQGVKGIAKGAAALMGGTAVQQAVVQDNRSTVGLESGFKQGLTNTLTAGAAAAALGGVSLGLSKLFNKGSSATAKGVEEIADSLEATLKQEIPDETRQALLRETQDLRTQAKAYKNNPHGSDFLAKQRLENNIDATFKDIMEGKPARIVEDPITKYVPTDKDYVKNMNKIFDDPDFEGKDLFNKSIKAWNEAKKASVQSLDGTLAADLPYSTVPVVSETSGIRSVMEFPSVEEARSFLNSKEASSITGIDDAIVAKGPNGYYLAMPADLEPSAKISGRLLGEELDSIKVGDVEASGIRGSTEAEIAKQFPEYTTVKELEEVNTPEPKYPVSSQKEELKAFMQQFEEANKLKIKEADGTYEAAIKQLDDLNVKLSRIQPEGTKPMLSLDDGLDFDNQTMQSIDDILTSFKEEKSAISQIFTCMTGKGA